MTKRCSGCKQHLPLSDYHKDASRDDGLCHYCRTCKNARVKITSARRRARLGDEQWYAERRRAVQATRRGKAHRAQLEDL